MDFAAGYLAGLAAKALTEELRLTPEAGVGGRSTQRRPQLYGSFSFLRSIDALTPWFRQITALSLCGADAAALQAAAGKPKPPCSAPPAVSIPTRGRFIPFQCCWRRWADA